MAQDWFPWQREDAEQHLAPHPRWLLANEMRTGKTGAALLGAKLVGARRVNVVCPAIVCREWLRQFEDFGLGPIIPSFGVTSYDLVARHGAEKCGLKGSDVLILDECHYLKNPDAKRTKAIYKDIDAMRAPFVWGLSGTPAPNHAGEYFTHAAAFGLTNLTYWQWIERYCRTRQTTYGFQVVGNRPEMLPELRVLLSRFISRRSQASVWKETPAPFWSVQTLPPTAADAKRLQELDANRSPADAMTRAARGEMARERQELGRMKVPYVSRYVTELLEENRVPKVLIGTWHLDVTDAIAAALRKYDPITIHGGVTDTTRWQLIDRFQTAPTVRVAIVQMKTGGVGINLSSAAHVVLAEPDWGRDTNEQFVQRPQHIARRVPLPVDLIALDGSLDETILRSNVRKRRMNREITTEVIDTSGPADVPSLDNLLGVTDGEVDLAGL